MGDFYNYAVFFYESFKEKICMEGETDIVRKELGYALLNLINYPHQNFIDYECACGRRHFHEFMEYIDLCSSNMSFCTTSALLAFADITHRKIPSVRVGSKYDSFNVDFANNNDIKDRIEMVMNIHKKSNLTFIMYECDNFYDIFFATLDFLFRYNCVIKKCLNCGLYFIPVYRSDTIYCNNPAPQTKASGRTCKEYGPYASREAALARNEAAGLYRKIYMSKQMLAKRNADLPEYQQSFDKFRSESKQWKADIKVGIKTNEEYIAWLKSVKEKKIL